MQQLAGVPWPVPVLITPGPGDRDLAKDPVHNISMERNWGKNRQSQASLSEVRMKFQNPNAARQTVSSLMNHGCTWHMDYLKSAVQSQFQKLDFLN
jgi:hypothetical protein